MRKVALITGGSRGIGLACARELAANGYDLAVNGLREKELVKDVLDELQEAGASVLYCRTDISNPAGRETMVMEIKEKFGRLNLLVNNAGVGPKQRLDALETTEESYDHVMDINLKAPYFLTQSVANYMIGQKQEDKGFTGAIINIGSVSATVVSVNRGEYCISKAGFAMHSMIWAVRLAEYDIPVYEVRPGVIKTDMTSAVTDKYDRLIEKGLNIQPRWGLPEDVGKAVLSLAQGSFPFSSGGVFMVDGGMTVSRL